MRINHVESLQLDSVPATGGERARILCARAKELEEAGKFEEAKLALEEFWPSVGERPKVDGLDEPSRADLLLRAGALSGWIGSTRQIPGAQEIAKDLISESSAIFERLGLIEKVAESRVDLGICYWREGALDEAGITLDDALQQLGDLESEQRLRALLNKAVVEHSSSRSKEALRILGDSESLFEVSSNQMLRGKFHNQFAVIFKSVGLAERREDYIDRALMLYTAASIDFEEAGHERLLAGVENNLGGLFLHLERFEEAHAHLDRALSVVTKSDKGRQAQFEDTRARVFLAQGNLEAAEKTASGAVKGFREGDEQSHLSAALTTYAVALARLGRHSDALATFTEAITVAAQAGDPGSGGIASLTVVEELSSVLSPTELRNYYKSADAALQRSQHPAIQYRLAECARAILATEDGTVAVGAESSIPVSAAAAISLEEQVLRYEGQLIERALLASDGSVTRAARLLGVTHQGLAFILNGRQRNLLPSRKPAKPRRRSIIRFH